MSDLRRQELENLWRTRVRDSALRLDFARNFLKEVRTDFPLDTLPLADGRYAHARALHAENNRNVRIHASNGIGALAALAIQSCINTR